MQIGYARVSTEDQHLELQMDALKNAGCKRIFTDQISGTRIKRPGLDNALSHMRKGDTLAVWNDSSSMSWRVLHRWSAS